jgi:putative phage-type endonuclease
MSDAVLLTAQGSPDWFTERCGKVTASRVGDLIARTKTGWSASRAGYMGQLIAERVTGKPALNPSSATMRWGHEHEPLAKAAYAFRTDLDVESVGFIGHPTIAMSGASPDGLIGSDGLIEVKCPLSTTHLETLAAGEMPLKHLPQIQWQLACTGRAWCDFVSFDPRMPEELKLFVQRVPRDDDYIGELEGFITTFLEKIELRVADLRRGAPLQEAA